MNKAKTARVIKPNEIMSCISVMCAQDSHGFDRFNRAGWGYHANGAAATAAVIP